MKTNDPQAQRKAEKEAKLAEAELSRCWRAVMGTKEGRAVVASILRGCSALVLSPNTGIAVDTTDKYDGGYTAYLAGRRSVGEGLKLDIITRAPEGFEVMVVEEIRQQAQSLRVLDDQRDEEGDDD